MYSLIEKFTYITHNKYYYLREKPMPLSTIYFDYVTDMFDQDIIEEILGIENKEIEYNIL